MRAMNELKARGEIVAWYSFCCWCDSLSSYLNAVEVRLRSTTAMDSSLIPSSLLLRLLLLLLFFIILFCKTKGSSQLPPNFKVPAVLVFGDSIMDTGNNNNNTQTLAKCNFPPYGRDFQGAIPTGRFGNGKVPSDLIGTLFFPSLFFLICFSYCFNLTSTDIYTVIKLNFWII